ncbi:MULTISPECIES: LiaF transmembrane domain-containing protein [unclassified Pseudomonas]|uniref:LiaF transmembrane domain-containing protein n=1 Tax=unclassified Pseudomonas TaxID=196821 RepID=UPI003D32F008
MSEKSQSAYPNLIWGVLIVIVGFALLAEQFGLISKDVRWFIPLVIVAYGANLIYQNKKDYQ